VAEKRIGIGKTDMGCSGKRAGRGMIFIMRNTGRDADLHRSIAPKVHEAQGLDRPERRHNTVFHPEKRQLAVFSMRESVAHQRFREATANRFGRDILASGA
jgi:hypothetical protein